MANPVTDDGLDPEEQEFDIPVLFQVRALVEDDAAEKIAYILGHSALVGGDTAIESWHMPNHQFADGSDNPVRVEIVPIEPAYSARRGLAAEIERLIERLDVIDDPFPTCDLCGHEQGDSPNSSAADQAGDWNGETGNHLTCERIQAENPYYQQAGDRE
jgi:hypothetical protein